MNVNSSIFSGAHLILPYGEQSFDTVRLNGAWVAFPLKSQNCNEVRRQKKREKNESEGWEEGCILHCWEQRVYVQRPHKAGVIHLKGFCVCATFGPGRFAFACAGRINKARPGGERKGGEFGGNIGKQVVR